MKVWVIISALFLALVSSVSLAQDGDGYRIFISADMEGMAGSATGIQVGQQGGEYAAYREIMTNEVLAAIEGARAAGATQFVISDSHGSMQNIILERLPKDVRLIRGRPRAQGMMQGIDNGHYDGIIFLGYHAGESNPDGVMAHTISGGTFGRITINGVHATEGMMNAGVAGEHGVPVIMISGDRAAVEEVSGVVGDMEKAILKEAVGYNAAEMITPEAAYDLIRERAEAAVGRIGDFEPFLIEGPVILELTFKRGRRAEILGWLPWVEQTDKMSIRHQAPTMTEMGSFLSFVISYPGD